MQKYIKEVKCDCCGKVVENIFGGYLVKTINKRQYDICNKCMENIADKINTFEQDLVNIFFTHKYGRDKHDCFYGMKGGYNDK